MTRSFFISLALATSLALPALAQQGVPGAHFIENWDLDEDGQVTLEEATQKRGEVFFMFDQDENGVLDDAEYDLFDETREADMQGNGDGHGKGANNPMRGVSEGMARAFNDVDADGVVTQDEFMERVPAWFDTMDRNGDKVVTTADFGPRKS